MKRRLVITATVALLTAGCGSQQTGYQITDRNHSLSVTREQQYPGSDWTNHFVVSRFPECQRRYKLKDSPTDAFKLDVYRVEPQVFIINHGKLWYVAETKACGWQQYKEPPPEPGELIGTFQSRDDALQWVDKTEKKDDKAAKPAR